MDEQREIVLVPFPYTDLTNSKVRPALIISNSSVNQSQDRICCLITSSPTKEGLLIEKKDFERGMLPFKSRVKPKIIFTINEKIIRKRLASVSVNFHSKILKAINGHIN